MTYTEVEERGKEWGRPSCWVARFGMVPIAC